MTTAFKYIKGGGKKEDKLHWEWKRGSDPQLKQEVLGLELQDIF